MTNATTIKTIEPFTVSAPAGTDIWRKPPSHNAFNAGTYPAVLPQYKLETFQRARLRFALPPGNQLRQYDQAGLLLHLTKPGVPENKTKWLKTGIEWYNGNPYISTVSCDSWSDWSIVPIPEFTSSDERPNATVEVQRLEKDQNTVWVYWIIRNAEGKEVERRSLRELAWMFADVEGWSIGIGGYACRPTTEGGEGILEAEFKEGVEFELWKPALVPLLYAMTTNPSHILIARNSRGHNPSASLSSPTETHAAASGIFRSSGSPPWMLAEVETDDISSEFSVEDNEEPIELDTTFTKDAAFPGTVKIIVQSTTFWAHKEVLFFASPFFEAALSGNWSETGRPQSISSVITISQPPSDPGQGVDCTTPPEVTITAIDAECEFGDDLDGAVTDTGELKCNSEPESSDSEAPRFTVSGSVSGGKAAARDDSLAKLEGQSPPPPKPSPLLKELLDKAISPTHTRKRRPSNGPDAVIVLKEERASTFHDFLKFVYPHLECTITWNNVEGLMNIAHKLCVSTLQRECLTFLLTHAAGKPIKAMRIAELFQEEELYRESSRFVLDNPGGWSEHELNTLSQETLLKLEKRRNWFLERVLKLGLTMIAKEYQCCPTCPDPPTCARLLEEKWRQAYHAVFRFGPPQPSMVFRYLRQLEGVSPPLAMTQTACQTSAKAFTATLFDRMFSLGVRGATIETTPASIGARVAVAAVAAATGPRRHFLYCTLKPEQTSKPKRSREN